MRSNGHVASNTYSTTTPPLMYSLTLYETRLAVYEGDWVVLWDDGNASVIRHPGMLPSSEGAEAGV